MDGEAWQIVRTFSLEAEGTVAVGFESQSPAGTGSTADFSEMVYFPRKISNVCEGE